MGEWREVRLGDIAQIRHGFAFDGRRFRDEPPGDIILSPANFAIGGGFQDGRRRYFAGPTPSEFVLETGTLLVTMTDLSKAGDTLGYPAMVPEAPVGMRYLHNQRLGKVEVRAGAPIDRRFLYYILCHGDYRAEVLASATGSTVRHTAPSRIEAYRFRLPPVAEQRRIAGILSTLDDKIELNRRKGATLEAVARLQYQALRSIADGDLPDGWRIGTIADLASNPRELVNPGTVKQAVPYIGLEHMPRGRLVLSAWGRSSEIASAKFAFREGDVLFGRLRPYFRKVGVAPLGGICSTDILVLRANGEREAAYVLGAATDPSFIDHAYAASTGTRMPRASWADLARYPIPIPPWDVLSAYSATVGPLISRARRLAFEVRSLTGMRDALLPRLLDGSIDVGVLGVA